MVYPFGKGKAYAFPVAVLVGQVKGLLKGRGSLEMQGQQYHGQNHGF